MGVEKKRGKEKKKFLLQEKIKKRAPPLGLPRGKKNGERRGNLLIPGGNKIMEKEKKKPRTAEKKCWWVWDRMVRRNPNFPRVPVHQSRKLKSPTEKKVTKKGGTPTWTISKKTRRFFKKKAKKKFVSPF